MPRCPSCGTEVLVVCADDGMCKDCSPCCRPQPSTQPADFRGPGD